jgi:hypothetical protein
MMNLYWNGELWNELILVQFGEEFLAHDGSTGNACHLGLEINLWSNFK